MRRLLALACALALTACGGGSPGASGAPGGGTPGGGTTGGTPGSPPPPPTAGGSGTWGGVAFPWPLFDGSVPDVPPAPAGHTWYCDAAHGNDAWDGTSPAPGAGLVGPKRTLGAALALPALAAGDTILLAGGIYREYLDVGSLSGQPGRPLTIGSYGHGTGAPILDGGLKPGPWTPYTAHGQSHVWQTSLAAFPQVTAAQPVLGIYVHSGTLEAALKEVPHGQITPYGHDPLPPDRTQADLTDGSSEWYFDPATRLLYADFGGTLGGGDPNAADASILFDTVNGPAGHQSLLVLMPGNANFAFIGLTFRAASWDAVYAESGGNTFDRCDVKFNGGAGIAFSAADGDLAVAGNHVTRSRIWMNVLDNWPRFNHGNATGGWPGGLSWYSQSGALAQGNVVYQNGGEGLILWGTNGLGGTAHVSQGNAVRQNVIYDNWSVNLYADNTQNGLLEQNFVFTHPRDPGQTFPGLLSLSSGYDTDWGKRLTPVNLSLADEPGSSFETPTGHAHLDGMTVVNNLFAGGPFGFLDYDDGTAVVVHGLKHALLANNTWILGDAAVPGQDSYGWRHLFEGMNPDASTASLLENNLFVLPTAAGFFVQALQSDAGPGITVDHNLYSGPGSWLFTTTPLDFAGWKAAPPAWDAHSLQAEAGLVDVSEFSRSAVQKPVYDWSKARFGPASPGHGSGLDLSSRFVTDFTGAARPAGAFDLGALQSR